MLSEYKLPTSQKIDRCIESIEENGVAIRKVSYKICSFQDLACVTLSTGFEAKRRINKCAYCGRLFFPQKRNSEKYCTVSCAKHARADQQAKRERKEFPEANKRRKSMRAMWHTDTDLSNEELDERLREDSAKYYRMKHGEITEEEYLTWLNTFYKRNYKSSPGGQKSKK